MEMKVQPVALRGSMVRGIPGALGMLGAIGFGVGIVDSGMREQLFGVLMVCLAIAVVFGGWGIWLHRRANRILRVTRIEGGVRLEALGVVLERPSVQKGTFVAIAGKRRYPVAWIRLDDGTHSVVVRKGLGVHEKVPSWPQGSIPETSVEPLYGDPMRLERAVR